MKRAAPRLRVRMTAHHDWRVPGKRAWVSFRAGVEYPVTKAQFDSLVPDYAVAI